ncbi:hypothetical protein ABXJ56_15675 [Microbacterium chocolatum]|uniref:hypothetical protein n=1 Tax=Microbacterium aurantiacum TaxID=162393 RepID=UPI00339018CB
MAKELSPEEAVERAQRAMDHRLASVRELAMSRQNVANVRAASAARLAQVEREEREKVDAAERDDVRAYSAAIDAGWTSAELRKIGFAEAGKKRTPRQRPARRSSSSAATTTTPADAAENGSVG